MAEWRYLRTGRVVHAIFPGVYRDLGPALCGVEPGVFSDWLGTGTQDEYERAAALPPCRACVARGARRPNPTTSCPEGSPTR